MYTIKKFSAKKTKIAMQYSGAFLCTIKHTKLLPAFTGFLFTNKYLLWLNSSFLSLQNYLLINCVAALHFTMCDFLRLVGRGDFYHMMKILNYSDEKVLFLLELPFLPIIYHHDWDCFRKVWALGFTLKIE